VSPPSVGQGNHPGVNNVYLEMNKNKFKTATDSNNSNNSNSNENNNKKNKDNDGEGNSDSENCNHKSETKESKKEAKKLSNRRGKPDYTDSNKWETDEHKISQREKQIIFGVC
jgi:hypothetical protein